MGLFSRNAARSPHSVTRGLIEVTSQASVSCEGEGREREKKQNPEVCGNSFCVGESSITLSQRFCFTVHIVSVSPGVKSLGGSGADKGSEKSLRLLKQLHPETPYNEYCILW